MCGFIAQLIEQRTGIAEVTGSNPVKALIFSGFFFPIKWENLLRWSFFTLISQSNKSVRRVTLDEMLSRAKSCRELGEIYLSRQLIPPQVY